MALPFIILGVAAAQRRLAVKKLMMATRKNRKLMMY
jgi:hypothetical protein